MAAWVAPAIEAAGSIAGSVASGLFGYNQAAKNRAFQERMYYQQLEDNRKNWEMVANYNLPSAELQRIKDAGLNPLLYYNGGVSQAAQPIQAGNAPQGSQGQARFENPFANIGSSLAQMRMLDSQIRNLDADTETKLADALLKSEETIRTKEETGKIKTEKDYNIASFELRLEATRSQNELNRELATKPKVEIEHMRKEMQAADKQMEYLENEIWNKSRMTDQEIAESKQRIENSIKITAKQCENLDADTRLKYAEAVTQTIMQNFYKSQSTYYDELSETEREVRDSKVKKYKADLFKAIADGNAAEIEKAIKQFEYSMLPEIGSTGYKWQRFHNIYIKPVQGVLGGALGGVAGAMIMAP